jgi:hypothetical protein
LITSWTHCASYRLSVTIPNPELVLLLPNAGLFSTLDQLVGMEDHRRRELIIASFRVPTQ